MMGLIDDDDVGAVANVLELIFKLVASLQIGVVIDLQPAVDAAQAGQIALDRFLPHRPAAEKPNASSSPNNSP